MATLILGAVGSAIGGGAFGGAILGLSGAAIGGFIGSTLGSAIDSWIVASFAPNQRIEGPRLDSLRLTSASEGAVLPRLFGRMRIGGTILWATDFREEVNTTKQGTGKGGGGKIITTEYLYYASFAIALTEGPITGIGRIWADARPMDLTGVTWRWYPGDESQTPDPFIAAKTGADRTPAYRGTAYIVFEELPLASYGNRLPQLSFEVFRPLPDPDSAEGLIRAVTLGPGTGEFGLATVGVTATSGGGSTGDGNSDWLGSGSNGDTGTTAAENLNASADTPDLLLALDRLQSMAPRVESVTLTPTWFGDDLRAAHCRIQPRVEVAVKDTAPLVWSVNGIARADAPLVSRDASGTLVFGGTPDDAAFVQAIRELKARGLKTCVAPQLLMDIPAGNTRPNPYSDNTSAQGQPAYPLASRITVNPARGFAGSADKTSAAANQIASFFGTAAIGDFAVAGTSVTWTGDPGDRGYRRFLLHYAHLCAAAGGVESFLIGSALSGLTTLRADATTFPTVAELRALATDLRAILGPDTAIGYGAAWSEYGAYVPDDGSGDVLFPLDPLWADPAVDFVGITGAPVLSDWRDGFDHRDALAGWPALHDRAYLQSNIAGGEGFDWTYASDADRAGQIRTPILDPVYEKPWVFRTKDLRSWWSNAHHDRPGGIESATPTAWVPQSKPIRFTALGYPALDRATNDPAARVDARSSASALPPFSRGWRDDALQRAALEAVWLDWSDTVHNPASALYPGRMVDLAHSAADRWDARPYPAYPALSGTWPDTEAWRLGPCLTGRLGSVSLAALVRHLCRAAGLDDARIDVTGLWGAVEGYVLPAMENPRSSLSTLARHFGFDAIESAGALRFLMRGRGAVGRVDPDRMVAASGSRESEPFELTRAQETELPQALKWTLARADEDYDAALVEARRLTVDTARIAAESFPLAVPPEEAERRCRRALLEAWTGRESARFALPPSRLALDPGDVLTLQHDGRALDYRLVSIADAEAHGVEALRQDRAAYDLPPGSPRPTALSKPLVFGAPLAVFLDLPQLSEDQPAHRPLLAVHARPWPGEIAVMKSASSDGFVLVTTLSVRARIGSLIEPLPAGPVSRFDLANTLTLDLLSGTLESVPDLTLFAGANALALESAPGLWEVLQAGSAELIAPGRYRLSRLLRGQRGTEAAMGSPTMAGARIVILDAAVTPLPFAETDLGLPWTWRVGPASRPVSDASFAAQSFTPNGRGLLPFAPVQIEEPHRYGRLPGDLTIRWTRRSRALVADAWEQVEVPLGEEIEAYEVEIFEGGTVKRRFAASSPSVLYTEAQQLADRGALLGPGDTLDLRIVQLSNRLGRGTPAQVTLRV